MGYLHINNLYKEQTILLFRECYALEKIHGTSAHIIFNFVSKNEGNGYEVRFFSGGESHTKFVSLFDKEKLLAAVKDLSIPVDKEITVFGEAYGGSQQSMSHTYGPNLKFIVFDVEIGSNFLSVPDAEDIAKKLGLEFVHYVKVSTDLVELNYQRDLHSIQAVRNGITTPDEFTLGKGKPREGIVLRPLIEMTLNNGERVICKHKGDKFKETATPRPVVDPTKMKMLDDATAVANEWVTNERLSHVLDKLEKPHDMTLIPKLIPAMVEDVYREGKGEFVESDAIKKAIGKKAVELLKGLLNSKIK